MSSSSDDRDRKSELKVAGGPDRYESGQEEESSQGRLSVESVLRAPRQDGASSDSSDGEALGSCSSSKTGRSSCE